MDTESYGLYVLYGSASNSPPLKRTCAVLIGKILSQMRCECGGLHASYMYIYMPAGIDMCVCICLRRALCMVGCELRDCSVLCQ